MTPTDNRKAQIRDLQRLQRRDRRRLIFMGVLLAGVLLVYSQVSNVANSEDPGTMGEPIPESVISLPPIDFQLLDKVKDAEKEDRILLEPTPFSHLAKMAKALQPGHLRALMEPSFPFSELSKNSNSLRGKPFRLRGEVQEIERLTRSIGNPTEIWYWVKTDNGDSFHFVTFTEPEELFGSENFILADGFFLKVYAKNINGTRISAPLFIGREIVPSVRKSGPVQEIDFTLLAPVRDQRLGEEGDLDELGLWHLLSHAKVISTNTEKRDSIFLPAPELDYELLGKMSSEPELYRGLAFQIPGRVPDTSRFRNSSSAGENPLRAQMLRYGYLGNLAFRDYPIHLVGVDEIDFGGDSPRWYYGWFLQLKGYEDTDGNYRRTPVFIICGDRMADRSAPPIMNEMIAWFLGIATLVAALLFWFTIQDRKSTQRAAVARTRRRQERQKSEEQSNDSP